MRITILLFFLTVLLFHTIITNPTEMLFPAYDTISVYSFWRHFFVDSVIQFGQIPLWNPYQFSGTPFVANPSSGMFYPLNLLFFLFPVDLTFGYLFILDIFLIGLFTYLFARSITLTRWSALVAAISFMFSGTITARIIPGHIIILDTILWFPLLLLFYEKAVQTNKLRYGIYAALPLGIMIIAGHTQFAIFGLLGAMLYYLLRVISERKLTKKLLAIPLFSVVLGFGLGAIQLLPMLELSKLTARYNGLSYEFAGDFSLHPFQYISALFPYFFGSPLDQTFWGKGNFHELSPYIGIGGLLLIVIALLFQKNKYVIIAGLLSLFSLLYAFGKYFFLFPFFYHFVPMFDSFRAPGRFLYLYAFFMAMLIGFGMQFFQNKELFHKYKTQFQKITFILLLLSGLFWLSTFLIIFFTDSATYEQYILRNSFAVGINHTLLYYHFIKDLLLFTIIFSFMSVLLFLKSINRINSFNFNLSVVIIIFLNLYLFSNATITTKDPNTVFKSPEVVEVIKRDSNRYRVFDMTGSLFAYLNRNGIESITTHDSSYLRTYRDFLWTIGPHENWPYESFIQILTITSTQPLNLLNVKYVITDKEITHPNLKNVYTSPVIREKEYPSLYAMNGKQFYLYKNTSYLKRAYIVDNPKDSQKVKILSYQPNKIELEASLSKPGNLVVSEIWYPGWKAYDNGKEITIHKANSLFRSLYLDKGKHTITFIFSPSSYNLGKIISLASLLFIIGIAFYLKVRKK